MAKKDMKLSTPNIETTDIPSKDSAKQEKTKAKNKADKAKQRQVRRRKIGKFFRDIISELKKVSWAKFRSNKESKGVWAKTGVVLLIVFAFLILITAMDLGLSELLKLLIQAGQV